MKGVSVLLPTRNSMPYLREHVERVRQWMDMVEEVIVVDSESTDGTAQYLQQELAGPKLRFFNHPPGLYESWNFGIAQARARYTYVSTVGDGVNRQGLAHLIDVADQEHVDVVLSPPRFIHAKRRKNKGYEWPIHWLIENARITEPRRIPAMQAFLITSLFAPSGILGSSASNLYRTQAIQRYPFPANFGHQGDTAWTIQNALRLSWAVSPRVLSEFVVHGYSDGVDRGNPVELKLRLIRLAAESWTAFNAGTPYQSGVLPYSELHLDLQAVLNDLLGAEEELARLRTASIPWCLRPAAWEVRRMRNALRHQLKEIADRIAAMDLCVDSVESTNL